MQPLELPDRDDPLQFRAGGTERHRLLLAGEDGNVIELAHYASMVSECTMSPVLRLTT